MISISLFFIGASTPIASLLPFPAAWTSWVSNLFISIGASIAIFAPLFFLERKLEGKLNEFEKSQKEIKRNQGRLEGESQAARDSISSLTKEVKRTQEELSKAVINKLASGRKNDEELILSVKNSPDRSTIIEAIARARELRLIPDTGCRTTIPAVVELYARFSPSQIRLHEGLTIPIEIDDSRPIESIIWHEGQDVIDFLAELALKLQDLGLYPGDAVFDSSEIFRELSDLLGLSHKAVTGSHGLTYPLGEVIQIVQPQWVINSKGIINYDGPGEYFISAKRFNEMDWWNHVTRKGWVDNISFGKAFDTAKLLVEQGEMEMD